MAWNEPGGNKPKDPWGGNQGEPPDLDEVFRKLKNRMSGIFGGGNASGPNNPESSGFGLLIVLLLVAVLLWAVFDATHVIDQTDRGVVTRFGKYDRTLAPGLSFTWPRPIESLRRVNVSQHRSANDRGSMLTRDENIVQLEFEIQYRVYEPEHYLFKIRDPETTLIQAAEATLRQVIGDNDMDNILGSGRAAIAADTKSYLQELLTLYQAGLEITQFNLTDVQPPAAVKEAFDDVTKAREDRETFKNEAQAYANSVIPEARGMAERMVQDAEAHKARVIAVSEGQARRFDLLREEFEKAPEVTRKRLYLETMEQVLANNRKMVIDDNNGNKVLYLPMDAMGERQSGHGRVQRRGYEMPSGLPEPGAQSGAPYRESDRSVNREGRK